MTFTILGEDNRLFYTAETLRAMGMDAICSDDLERIGQSDALILPVPVSRDNETVTTTHLRLDALVENVPTDCKVFCGMPTQTVLDLFGRRNISVYDYAAREEFAVRNAVPTAEGVAELLMHHLPITLRGAKILITGYGRTAKACARLLTAMGAGVLIAARRCSALAMANGDGYDSIYLREVYKRIGEVDAVINTVPAPVLEETALSAMRRSAPVVEVASAPYGVDKTVAEQLGVQVLSAPALPGKVAPKTAGIIIADTVLNILREEKP